MVALRQTCCTSPTRNRQQQQLLLEATGRNCSFARLACTHDEVAKTVTAAAALLSPPPGVATCQWPIRTVVASDSLDDILRRATWTIRRRRRQYPTWIPRTYAVGLFWRHRLTVERLWITWRNSKTSSEWVQTENLGEHREIRERPSCLFSSFKSLSGKFFCRRWILFSHNESVREFIGKGGSIRLLTLCWKEKKMREKIASRRQTKIWPERKVRCRILWNSRTIWHGMTWHDISWHEVQRCSIIR